MYTYNPLTVKQHFNKLQKYIEGKYMRLAVKYVS